eukprot:scaffold6157_cov166-Chaetoceros_neogracile.AAC.1
MGRQSAPAVSRAAETDVHFCTRPSMIELSPLTFVAGCEMKAGLRADALDTKAAAKIIVFAPSRMNMTSGENELSG